MSHAFRFFLTRFSVLSHTYQHLYTNLPFCDNLKVNDYSDGRHTVTVYFRTKPHMASSSHMEESRDSSGDEYDEVPNPKAPQLTMTRYRVKHIFTLMLKIDRHSFYCTCCLKKVSCIDMGISDSILLLSSIATIEDYLNILARYR